MRIANVSTFPVDALARNCARCGSDFNAIGREFVCPACKKPRMREEREATRRLSMREQQIVQLIQQAKSNKEIAFDLHLSEGTVKEYIRNIFRKLTVRNRTELALWGRDNLAAA